MIAQINACVQDYVRIKCSTYNTFILNEETFHPQGNEHWLFYMCKIKQYINRLTVSLGEGKLLSLVLKLHRKGGNVAQFKNICV